MEPRVHDHREETEGAEERARDERPSDELDERRPDERDELDERPNDVMDERRPDERDELDERPNDVLDERPAGDEPGERDESWRDTQSVGETDPATAAEGASPVAEERHTAEDEADRDVPPIADEQLTVPEDREAAAVAEGRAAPGAPSGGGGPFELISGDERDGYRRRWDTLQADFVDDPRRSTEQADALVGELVERVTQRHRELREGVGDRSGERGGDTEALRLGLRRYRDLFNTLVGR